MEPFVVKIKPLSPIWTGDAKKKCTIIRETGILGSIRWWYEAVVRGLGGTACDPTNSSCEGEKHHCDACELFGCTGWARKFRLELEQDDTNEITLSFIAFRGMKYIETILLSRTFELIEDYGALGGKMVSEKNGLIKIISSSFDNKTISNDELNKYFKKKVEGFVNSDFRYFFFVTNGLNRSIVKDLKSQCTFLKGKKESKGGREVSYSKTYFYKLIKNNSGKWQPHRLFGYVKNDSELSEVERYFNGKELTITKSSDIINKWLEAK